ncbi:MAG: CDGSH iron-sulfur domain-containing protein [Deltaproteobacteria bacterium]|nr:CDGSH iron-sulfur domain-containing protein [Deltaproteobacteria bacterium]
MTGAEDGARDAILAHTQAETGAYYFCPPIAAGRLVLPTGVTVTSAPKAKLEVVESKDARIRFEAQKCIHSRHCVLARPDVFVPNVVGPWIHPEVATPEEVAELAHRCPSGAIQYDRLDGGPAEKAPKVNTVRVRENGPLAFHAELEVSGKSVGYRATMCRCGASQNKPFCDGSHARVGFAATGEPLTIDTPSLSKRDGKLLISPQTDGPLVVDGNLEVVSGTGRTVAKVRGPTLCRCGSSANKPFCDGSHARVGFRAAGD